MTRILLIVLLLTAWAVPAIAVDQDGDGVDDEFDSYPCDPEASSVVFTPAEGGFGFLLFEDSWPANGDLDFNDLAAAYNYRFHLDAGGQVTQIQLSLNVLAVGASTANGLALHLPVPAGSVHELFRGFEQGPLLPLSPEPGEPELVVVISNDTRDLFANVPPPINTSPALPSVPAAALTVRIRFVSPQTLDLSEAPFDLFVFRVGDASHQIHGPEYPGTATMNESLFGTQDDASTPDRHFVNHIGMPFALSVPSTTFWPLETVRIEQAYPDVLLFAATGGQQHQDWYQTNVNAEFLWTGGAGGTPPPVPRIPIGPPARCDDGNECTEDSCGPTGECLNLPVIGKPCEDHDACTTADTCVGLLCVPGPSRDVDGDTHVDAACGGDDCDDGNPVVFSLPEEILDLHWTDPLALGWAPGGPDTHYSVLRGDVQAFPVGSSPLELCLVPETFDLIAVDATPLLPGRGFWYLVRGLNSCGSGTYGIYSDGIPRRSSTCP